MDSSITVVNKLEEKSLEERTERETLLRSNPDQWDERTPLERLFDYITRVRITYYRPHEAPSYRQDLLCLCCGHLYRPDDPMDGINIYLCLSCKSLGTKPPEEL